MFYNSLAEQHANDVKASEVLDKAVKANVSRRKYKKIMLAAAKELMNRRLV